jgi:hypothetical protein
VTMLAGVSESRRSGAEGAPLAVRCIIHRAPAYRHQSLGVGRLIYSDEMSLRRKIEGSQ